MKRTEHQGVYLKLNKAADGDIIHRLDEQKNKQGYIKDLIRTDIDLDIFRTGSESGVVNVKDSKSDNNNPQGDGGTC